MVDIQAQKAGARFASSIHEQQRARIQQAVTGKTYDDGSKSLRGTSGNSDQITDGRIYVTLRDGSVRAAWNMTTALDLDIPVWVDRNPKGHYRVIGIIEDEGYAQFGSGAGAKNSPVTAVNDIIYASRIGPGRAKLYSPSGAIGSTGMVIVVDDFAYIDSAGNLKLWTVSSGTLDLTASIPGSGLHTLALIALNPSSTVPALTITTLTTRPISQPFTSADYGSFSLTAGYIPLLAYDLRNGDTTFLASRCDYNVRQFLAPKPLIILTSQVTGVLPAANGGAGMLFDAYADVTVGGAEADIFSYTSAANTLANNGDKIEASYSGNFVTVGTESVQLKQYFGGTAIWDSTGVVVTTGTSSFRVGVEIIRVSSSVVRYSVSLTTSGAFAFNDETCGELTGLTLSNTNILKLTGASSGVGSGVGDIIGKMAFGRKIAAA